MEQRNLEKVGGTLRLVGLEPDRESLAVAQKLVQHGLPVTRENVEILTRAARQMGENDAPRALEVAAYTLARGGKTAPEALQALGQFIDRRVVVKQVLEQVVERLAQINGRQDLENAIVRPDAGPAGNRVPAETLPGFFQSKEGLAAESPQPTETASGGSQPQGAGKNDAGSPEIADRTATLSTAERLLSAAMAKNLIMAEAEPVFTSPQPGFLEEIAGQPALRGEADAGVAPGIIEEQAHPEQRPSSNLEQPMSGKTAPQKTEAAFKAETTLKSPSDAEAQAFAAGSGPDAGRKIINPDYVDGAVPAGKDSAQDKDNAPTGVNSGPSRDLPESALVKSEKLLRLLLPLLSVDAGDREHIAREVKQAVSSGRDALKVLDVIKQVMEQELKVNDNSALREPLQLVNSAEKELIGQAVFNSFDKSTVSQQGFYYFVIPVSANNQEHMVELRLYQDETPRRPLSEQNEVKIALSLATNRMGTVVFHVTWHKNQGLTLQGAVENERTRDFIQSEIPDLTGSLEALGYKVRFLGMKVAGAGKGMRPGMEIAANTPKILGIDIKI
jgi:hypothetical protein